MPKTKSKEKVSEAPPQMTTMPLPLASPKETVERLAASAVIKCGRKDHVAFLLALMSGFYLSVACIATSSVTYSISNVGVARMVTALLFPFGLMMIIFTGAELYTGNNLIFVGVLDKKVSFSQMFRSWCVVYLGNFLGCLLVATLFLCTKNIHMDNGLWAENMIKIAAGKINITWIDGFILGIFCNMLVTVAVYMVTSTTDPVMKVISALVPVSLFVMAGFEHCIAYMFYIPMGLLLHGSGEFGSASVDGSLLTFGNFITHNLIPVTIGNTLGGLLIASIMWYGHKKGA